MGFSGEVISTEKQNDLYPQRQIGILLILNKKLQFRMVISDLGQQVFVLQKFSVRLENQIKAHVPVPKTYKSHFALLQNTQT